MASGTVLYTAIATFIAALMAALASFLVAVMSKEQKISEFRQAWIDALRNDISEFESKAGTLLSFAIDKKIFGINDDEISKFINDNYQNIQSITLLSNRIKLRLNPNEYNDLINCINKLQKYIDCKLVDVKKPEIWNNN